MVEPGDEVYVETVRQWRRGWWGGHWEPPHPLSVIELMRAGSVDAPLLALVWLMIDSHASVLVAAEPPEAGKTTTLTALLEFVPPQATRVYTRGFNESFTFLQHTQPDQTWILCNEISPDLQVYTWGPAVRALGAALERGYAVATTMHADTLEAIVDVLAGYPLDMPRRQIGHLSLILTLRIRYTGGRIVRRVRMAQVLEPDAVAGGGFRQTVVAEYEERRDQLVHNAAPALAFLAARTGREPAELARELARRAAFLTMLDQQDIADVGRVRRALARYDRGAAP